MLAGLKVDRDRALVMAAEGYTNATDLADYLVRLGVPFREAHHQVGRLVRTAIEQDRALEDLPLDVIRQQAPKANQDVYAQLTVGATLEKRAVEGGTAVSAVEDAIARVRRMLRERAVADPAAGEVEFRQARADDLDAIEWLVEHWAKHGENLPRSREDIMKAILDFGVAVVDGTVVGCAALWIYTPQLAEIRSLGVHPDHQGKGVGQGLVRYFLQLAGQLRIPKVFVLTRAPKFFEKAGFRQVSVNSLPEKVLKDCAGCPKREQCDEIALVHDVPANGNGGR
jgi:argininosuccinate lyase/amino-acid N-acetyltransferase